MFTHTYRTFIGILCFLFCFSLLIPTGTAPVRAQAEEIRVALFVASPTGYNHTVPFVSISSDTGMSIHAPSGAFEPMNQTNYARFMLDQYFLIAGETKHLQEARQLSQTLAGQGFSNLILAYPFQGETLYRVITGSEATYQAIASLQQQLLAKANRAARIAGPYRVQAGSFPSLAEAKQQLAAIQAKGFTGAVAQVRQGANVSYQVWIGDEVSSEAQSKLQAALAASFSGISFQPAHGTEYILSVETVMLGTQATPLYLVSPELPITILPNPAGITPLLQVEERENRRYRGKIELSRHRNKLAVVNILPLEEYLYSVVGTEMATGWPIEALKAQAVMSRNFAYLARQQNKYGVAHVSDTTFEQAYYGYDREAEDIRQAVEATRGEFLTYKGQIFTTFYHSNAGGMTAEGFEVWGNPVETHRSVPSNDRYPETVQATWYRVQDSRGKFGYVISQYVQKTNERSALGFPIGVVTATSLNYRSGPSTDQAIIGSLSQGERVIIFDEVKQNNAYSWIEGPYTGQEIQAMVNSRAESGTSPRLTQPVVTLEVTERGPSGRVLRIEGNGQVLHYASPDGHRSLFSHGGRALRSNKFEVEAMGAYTLLGKEGQVLEYPRANGQKASLYAVSGGATGITEANGHQDQFALYNQHGEIRIVSKQPAFRFHGFGYGHGLGASQWGIYAMALEGYNYRQILQHYFHQDSVVERKY